MNLTPNMRILLVAILEEMRRLEAVGDRPPPGTNWDLWRDLWRQRREYEEFGVPHNLARWLGHAPTPSESAVFSRALRNMEMMGLVVRVSRWDSARATHIQLTDMGRAEAERLVAEQDAAMAALLKDLGPLAQALGQAPSEGPQEGR
ncbi:MAG: hypothetical protein FJ288_19235 [Planctomycetes bacterium]|nr:hypothetical protein [Planctomycetota bacterium]